MWREGVTWGSGRSWERPGWERLPGNPWAPEEVCWCWPLVGCAGPGRRGLPSVKLVPPLELGPEVAPLEVEVKDLSVVHRHAEWPVRHVGGGLPQDLAEDISVGLRKQNLLRILHLGVEYLLLPRLLHVGTHKNSM